MNGMTLDNLLAQFESESSIAILFFMIGAFLFGLLVNALLSGARKRKLRAQLKEAENALAQKEAELTGTKEELESRTKELETEAREKVNLIEQMQQVEQDKKRVYTEVYNLNTELEEYKTERHTHLSTISELNTELAGLEDRIAELESGRATRTVPESDEPLTIALSDDAATSDRLALVEKQLAALVTENQRLSAEMDSIKQGAIQDPRPVEASNIATIPNGESSVGTDQGLAINPEKKVMGGKIIVDDRPRDPLAQIQGIDAFLEQKLNQIGIYSFEDITQLSRSKYAEVEQRIGWLPGRIQQDDWVGQAKRLFQMKNAQPQGFDQVVDLNLEDDLKKMEGIGPKIEEILKAGGIRTWETLASTDPDQIRAILLDAGDRYRMHNPDTWPAQARLAANGQWEELSAYQQELKNGKEK